MGGKPRDYKELIEEIAQNYSSIQLLYKETLRLLNEQQELLEKNKKLEEVVENLTTLLKELKNE